MTVPTIFEGISEQPEATSTEGLFVAAESSDTQDPTRKLSVELIMVESSLRFNIKGSTYKGIGNISDHTGQSLEEANKLNAYQYPDNSGEWYGPVQSQLFPITIPSNPSSDIGWIRVSGNAGKITDISFETYSEMKANNNEYIYFTGQKVKTGVGTWKITAAVTPTAIANTSPQLYATPLNGLWLGDWGIIADADISVDIREAISVAEGRMIHIPLNRYKYDRLEIADERVNLNGSGMPTVKTGFTGLENGTIIDGTMFFSGKNLSLTNFGIDLGVDTSEAPGDGLKCTTDLNDGEHLHLENFVAVGNGKSDAFHSVLLESYQLVTGGNIEGVNNLFSVVIKCQDLQLSSVRARNSQSRGLYLKSDNIFGKSSTIQIDRVDIDGNGSTGQGLYIQADGDQLDKVQLGQVRIKGYAAPAELNVTGAGTAINEVQISDLTIVGSTSNALQLVAAVNFIYNVQISNLTIIDCDAKAIETNGVINHLQVNNLFVSYRSGTLDSVMENAVRFVSSVRNTELNNVTITRAYGSNESDFGYINYENNSSYNTLGTHQCKIKGAGIPVEGVVTRSGLSGSTTLQPVVNRREKITTITTEATANVTVTGVSNERYPGVLFEVGTILQILNNSGFTVTVNHNPGSGNVRNKNSSNIVLGGSDAQSWVLSSSGVWTEV